MYRRNSKYFWSTVVFAIKFLLCSVSSSPYCEKCIQTPSALWCANPMSINSSRCYIPGIGPQAKWIESCSEDYVIRAPKGFNKNVTDEPFSDPDDNNVEQVVQIKPQVVRLGLPPGGSQTVNMTFKYVSDYSLGLYYLMDLSKSMDVDRKTILDLADILAFELQKLTPFFKLGFGTFLDKVNLPYVNTHSEWLKNPCSVKGECRKPYGFQNILSLTNDTDAFIKSVENAKTSTNWDDPEGGLDALMQVMTCDSIGWEKKKTRHLIVYVSGSAFKYAGDGKLAGITEENDMQCHLDDQGLYTFSSLQDYPSISQIQRVSSQENMHIIFAVKKTVIPLYEALTKIITQSEASLLSDDSSNIIDIITNFYKDISHSLKMEIEPIDNNVEVFFKSKCEENEEWKLNSTRCDDVDVNKEVKFEVTFELKKCPESGRPITIKVSPEGLKDEMIVQIEALCQCSCTESAVPSAPECSGNGTLECGICKCDVNFSGEFCQCQLEEPSIDGTLVRSCRAEKDTSGKDCNGRGICRCGKCECKENIDDNPVWKYQGEFCEYSNFECLRNKEGICSNNGLCEYSQCICEKGWKKEDCSCALATDRCISPENDKICSGNGDCICNQCNCHETKKGTGYFFFGQVCEDCQNCTGQCDFYQPIVKEKIENSDTKLKDDSSITITEVDELKEEKNLKICHLNRDNGCIVRFSYNPHIDNLIFIEAETCPANAIAGLNLIMIIIIAIVVIGVVILLVWKCWVTQKDKREYAKFEQEAKEVEFFRLENPLYRDPITRVTNPLHGQKEEIGKNL